ncbi:MAG: hypothetical protein WCH46_10010 [bacterium]
MYKKLLEDEIFMKGETNGRMTTALTILTDLLIDINALEVYYQKPTSKEISPATLNLMREKINLIKEILPINKRG